MRLLLDENLSPRLVESLYDLYPGSQHVDLAGLRGQPDQAIWEYARRNDLAIVSKDNDFRQLSFLYGPPPKVIWLGIGNAGTQAIAHLLRQRRDVILEFAANPEEGLLVLELTAADA